ncbi:MAG: WD40 repeat domain-containing protein [Gaiellales bacterium]
MTGVPAVRPYRGLSPFSDADLDARLFFGRERETELVVANLQAARLTVLYGASGVGKSSLLHAGVAHRLREAGPGAPRHVVVACDTWSGDPVTAVVREAVACVSGYVGREVELGEGTLADRLERLTIELDGELYLVLDQFEEYLLYHGSEGGGPLVDELAGVLALPSLRVGVLLGIRDDALAELDVLKARVPTVFSNLLRLDHLTRAGGRDAILRPLAELARLGRSAVSAEPALVEAVLDGVALSGAPAEPLTNVVAPFLQLVMSRVWEAEAAAASTTLRAETLERLGGPEKIVEDHLGQALSQLQPHERDTTARLFRALVTPSGTKIAHSARDLAEYVDRSADVLEPLLERLAAARILAPIADDRGGERRFEILHDVLAEAVLAWSAQHQSGRELERARQEASRRHRRLAVVTGASLVGLACAVALMVWALVERAHARDRAVAAQASELQALSVNALATDSGLAVALAAEAARRSPSAAADDALRRALLADRLERIVPVGSAVTALAYVGRDLVLGTETGFVERYSPGSRELTVVARHRGAIVAVVPSGRETWSADRRGVVRRTGEGPALVLRHPAPLVGLVADLRCGSEVPCLATAGGRTIVTWDAASGHRLDGLELGARIEQLARLRDGKVVALAGDRLWIVDPARGRLMRELRPNRPISTIAASPDRELVAAGLVDGSVRVWNAGSGRLVASYVAHTRRILDLDLRGDLVATGSADGSAVVRSLATGTVVGLPGGHGNTVRAVGLSRDGGFAVTASADRSAKVWDTGSGRLVAVLTGHGDVVVDARFSADAAQVATGGLDRTIRLWASGAMPELVASTSPAPRVPVLKAQAKTGAVAVAAGDEVRLQTVTGRTLLLTGHRDRVSSVSFSDDGGLLVTASRDHAAVIWDARTGVVLHRLEGHFGAVADARFSPDGRWVVTAGPIAAGIWDVRTGALLSFLYGPTSRLVAAAFGADGQTVTTLETAGTVREYVCAVCTGGDGLLKLAARHQRATGRTLTDAERSRFLR